VTQGVKNHLMSGNSVVVDDNCLRSNHRKDLRSAADMIGVKSILIYLDLSFDVLKKRKENNKILKTRHDVPSAWMVEDSLVFERPTEEENPVLYTENISSAKFFESLESQFW